MHLKDRARARDTCVYIEADARDSIESGQRLMRSIKAPGHDMTCREDPGRDGKVLFYKDSF